MKYFSVGANLSALQMSFQKIIIEILCRQHLTVALQQLLDFFKGNVHLMLGGEVFVSMPKTLAVSYFKSF